VPRFVVDCDAALHVVAEEIVVAPEHALLAPTLPIACTGSVG
jgi:hypothetical protein